MEKRSLIFISIVLLLFGTGLKFIFTMMFPADLQTHAPITKVEEKVPTDEMVESQAPSVSAITGTGFIDPYAEIEFIRIEGGCYEMGSPKDEEGRKGHEGPLHEVCVDDFYIGKYEVTQGQWVKVLEENPSYFKDAGESFPIENISWQGTQKYIKALSKKSGFEYRLPTEAEWEYAARAGTKTPFFYGETISTRQANYKGKYTYGDGTKGISRNRTTPVGTFPANAFGLYDMHGNVFEWCQDWFDLTYYSKSPKKNPKGPKGGSLRVGRGGSYGSGPIALRSAYRGKSTPGSRSRTLGFRLAFTAGE